MYTFCPESLIKSVFQSFFLPVLNLICYLGFKGQQKKKKEGPSPSFVLSLCRFVCPCKLEPGIIILCSLFLFFIFFHTQEQLDLNFLCFRMFVFCQQMFPSRLSVIYFERFRTVHLVFSLSLHIVKISSLHNFERFLSNDIQL